MSDAAVIICVGSPFAADQLAWQAASLLEKDPRLDALLKQHRLTIETCDRPGAHLLNLLKQKTHAVLVDAVKSNVEPGSVVSLSTADILTAQASAESKAYTSVHEFGVAQALLLADALGELPKKTQVYGLSVGDADWQPTPSQIHRLVDCIVTAILNPMVHS